MKEWGSINGLLEDGAGGRKEGGGRVREKGGGGLRVSRYYVEAQK